MKDGVYTTINDLTGEVEYEVIVDERLIATVKSRVRAWELLLIAKAEVSAKT